MAPLPRRCAVSRVFRNINKGYMKEGVRPGPGRGRSVAVNAVAARRGARSLCANILI